MNILTVPVELPTPDAVIVSRGDRTVILIDRRVPAAMVRNVEACARVKVALALR